MAREEIKEMGESEVETEARESAVSFLTKELARSPKAP